MPILLALLLIVTTSCAAKTGDLYLNIIWHQHQPLYLDPETDELRGPWVRTHATKDYYDMAELIGRYPEIHATINLTSSLLMQLQDYYVVRLSPHLRDGADGKREIDAAAYFAAGRKTDPWIDLALRPTESFTEADRAKLVSESWNAFGISDVQIQHFPEYLALRTKARDSLTTDDLRDIKAWFFLAHFDPDFLRGTSPLDVNLTDLVEEREGKFYRDGHFSERDANRLVADAVRVMQEVRSVHGSLDFDNEKRRADGTAIWQCELITTPFYHPILPLLIDSDIARTCQPNAALPNRFAYPSDAEAQIVKGSYNFVMTFGYPNIGMWPAEGSISKDAAEAFAKLGMKWICGDMHVLSKSKPSSLPVARPYRIESPSGPIAIVFRETTLSDHIGFSYQKMEPKASVEHFIREILKFKPKGDEGDCLLTVILDGENAWEWYEHDMDGKEFLRGLYERLTALRENKVVTCVTPTEYFMGNPERGVPPHPIKDLTEITELWPGSWINANYDTWIGESEENKAWEYLLQTRRDLEMSGLPQPPFINNAMPEMTRGFRESGLTEEQWYAASAAYESMYAAEGSDWFWWYGADQSAGGGDKPFEDAFFSHLRAVYRHMQEAGVKIETPEFAPILSAAKRDVQEAGGAMARNSEMRQVRFECEARRIEVLRSIFIAGNRPEFSDWNPNVTALFDDGTRGDVKAKDGVWSLLIELPVGAEIQYKYTNSGEPGQWQPSEEFQQGNRAFTVEAGDGPLVRHDKFGVHE
ncbi:hypothetical protein IT157_09625 [bacterium]|nr:hypothetical protein [bacterium]